ncbi:Vacuolar protein sorting-associated protein [Klebsormidium nitens]|uniref:Vacuolar protein sorting-associated protein n=1 Tax=Klebsormidium nitens TaxID=105231 RepID=A0A1Y1HXB5_KLENI|nr:Vacuolar protein sorting-associated protein [Klebsormidium nitens]|eukprot:GAQ80498.1 Vacuolar protein sorting-associated protein [Klebsormidium nitens]
MFEGFVYQLLAGYLGHYVKDIQREQLRIGLWSGVALLENVEIRLEAFDYLQLPFAIQSGTIGKLQLQVPWKRLGWDPIIVALEDVVVTSGPREDAEWEAGPAEKRALAAKKAKLAAAEIRKLSERVSEDKSGQSFMSYLSAKIIDNVQVAVKNIHIKYEDPHTHPEGPFCFGIVLSGLNLRSAEGWQLSPTASSPTASGKKGASNFVHKMIEVDRLGAYWNSQSDLREKQRRRARGAGLPEPEPPLEEYAYLMRPVDVKIKLAINKSAVLDKSTPQHSVLVDVEGLSFALEELQFQEMLLLLDAMSIYDLREKYGKYRPNAELIARPRGGTWQRAWWQYAINAVLSDIHAKIYRPTWRYLSWRRDMRKRYVAIYKKKLDRVRHGQAPDSVDSAQLEKMEEKLDVEDITFFRSWAEGQMKVEAAALSRRESAESPGAEHTREQQGWLSWVSWGLLGAGGSSIDAGGFTGAISDKDLKELYKAMDFYPSLYAEDSAWPKEYCHTSLALTVQEALFALRSSYSKRDIMRASLLSADVSVRMRRDSTSVSLTLGSLEAEDLCSPGSTFSRIVCPKNSAAPIPLDSTDASSLLKLSRSHSYTVESPTGSWANLETLGRTDEPALPLVRIEAELHPEELNVDVRVLVAIQPLEIVYSPAFIKRAAMFFNHPASIQTHQELVVSALNGLENLRARTISKAEYVFSTRMRTSFQINVHAPLLIIPEAGQETGSTLLVVDFGLLQLTSGVQPQMGPGFSRGTSGDGSASRRMTGPGVGPWSQEELRDLEPGMKRSASFPGARRLDSLPRGSPDAQNSILKEITDSALYDRFHFEVKDLQIAVARQSSDWRAILEQDGWDARVHLVNRFDLKLIIDTSSLPSDTTITRTKILGNLPTVYLHLSVCKLQSLSAVLDSLTRPEAQPTSNLASSILSATPPGPPSGLPSFTPPPAQWALSPYETPSAVETGAARRSERLSFVEPKGGVKETGDAEGQAPLVELRLCVEAAAVEVSLGEALVPTVVGGGGFVDGKVVLQLSGACIGFKQLPLRSTLDLTLASCHIEDFSKPLYSAQRFLLQPSPSKQQSPLSPDIPRSQQTPEMREPFDSDAPFGSDSSVVSFRLGSAEDPDGTSVSEFSVRLAEFVFQCNRATLAAITAFAQAVGATEVPVTPNNEHASARPEALASIGEAPTSPKASTFVNSSSPFITPVKPGLFDVQSTASDVPRGRQTAAGSVAIERLEVHFNAADETLGVIIAEGAEILVDIETLGTDVRWLTRGAFGRLLLDAPVEGRGVMRLWDAVPNADSCRNCLSVGTLPLESCRSKGKSDGTVGTEGDGAEASTFRSGGESGQEVAEVDGSRKTRGPATTAKAKSDEPGISERFEAAADSEVPKLSATPEVEELLRGEADESVAAPNELRIAVTVQQVHAILFGTFITRATAYFTHEEWASGHIFADDTPTLSGLSEDVILSVPEDESSSSEKSLTVVYQFSITDCILDLPSTLEEPQSRIFPQVALPQLTVGFLLLGDTCTAEDAPQLSMSLSVEGRGLSLTTWDDGVPGQGGWKAGTGGGGQERDGAREKALGGLIDGLNASLGMKWFTERRDRDSPPMEVAFDSPGLQVNLTKNDVAILSAILEHNLLKMDFTSSAPDGSPRSPSPLGDFPSQIEEALLMPVGPDQITVVSPKSLSSKASLGDGTPGSSQGLFLDASVISEGQDRGRGIDDTASTSVRAGVGCLLVSFRGGKNEQDKRPPAVVALRGLGLVADVGERSGNVQLTWGDVTLGKQGSPVAGEPGSDTWLDEEGERLLRLRASGAEEGVRFSWGRAEVRSADVSGSLMEESVSAPESERSSTGAESSSDVRMRVGLPEASVWLAVEDWTESVAAISACFEIPIGGKSDSEGKDADVPSSKQNPTDDLKGKEGATSGSRVKVDVSAPLLKFILPNGRKEWDGAGFEEHTAEAGFEGMRFDGSRNGASVYDSDSEPDEIVNPRTAHSIPQRLFSGQFGPQNTWQADGPKRSAQTVHKSVVLTLDVRAGAQREAATWHLDAAVEQALLTAETRQQGKPVSALPLLRLATLHANAKAFVVGIDDVSSLSADVDADVSLGAVESWCSFPILRFFRDFGVEGGGAPANDGPLAVRGRLTGRLGRASFLLSDCRWYNNAPIVELLLSELRLTAGTDVRNSSLSVTADIVANYHNIEKVAWEPLVEPYSFILEVDRSANEATSGKVESQTQVHLVSRSMLNVNITEGLVKAAMRASEVVREGLEYSYDDEGSHAGSFDEGPTGATHKRRYAPYWLKNDTGVTLRYWLSSSRTFTGTVTTSATVPPGKSAPIYVEEDPGEGRGLGLGLNPFGHVQHRMIQVQLEGSGVRSDPMSIDRVGGHVFPVVFTSSHGMREDRLARQSSAFPVISRASRVGTPLGRQLSEFPMTSSSSSDDVRVGGRVISGLSLERTASGVPPKSSGHFRTHVVCDVQLRRYSKMVVFKSLVALTNKTSVPLDLCFEMPFALEGKVLGPIPPGQPFPFPIHQAGGSGRVRWRPSGDTHFWSEAQALSNLFKTPESGSRGADTHVTRPHRSIVCAPNRPQGKPFRFCMDVASSELPTTSGLETVSSTGRKKGRRGLGSQGGEDGPWRTWEVKLLPPVVIENWLPCAVAVSVEAGGVTLADNTRIAKGQSAHIFEADSHQELRLTFKPAGFGATSVVTLPRVVPNSHETDGLEGLSSMEVLELTAEHSGAKVTVELETTVSLLSGTRNLFLSCGYWLFNCTDLQLVFQDASASRSDVSREQPLPPPPRRSPLGSQFRNPPGLEGAIKTPTEADEPFERKRSWPDAAGLEAALTTIPESETVRIGHGSDTPSVRSSVNASGLEPGTPSLSRESSFALSSVFGASSPGKKVIRQGANASASILPPGSRQQSPGSQLHTPKARSRLGKQDSFTPTGMREGSEYSFGGVDTPASSRPGSPFSYANFASTSRFGGNGSLYGNGSIYGTRSLQGARSLSGFAPGADLQAVMYGRPPRGDADEPQLKIRVMKPAKRGSGTGHVAASEWSKPFGLDPAGGVSVVYIPRWKKGGLYVMAVSSIPAMGACVSRTKTVTVRPRYVLVNALHRDLVYKQQGTESYQHLAAGQHRPFHWTDVKRNFRVCLRFDENGWDWSGGFAPDQLGDILLKMRQQSNRAITMVRVDVSCPDPPEGDGPGKMAGGGSRGVGTCVVVISEDRGGFVPYRIENFSTETVRFHQERCEEADDLLRPYSSCLYAWDEPCRPHRLVMTVPGASKLGTFSLDTVWEYPRLHLSATTQRPERTLQVAVRADGPTRVISVSDVSMHSWEEPEGSGAGSSWAGKGERPGEAAGPSDMTLEVTVKVAGVGVSVIDSRPQELLYGCTRGVSIRFVRGTHEQMAEFHVASLQLDNQLRHATYPVLLSTSEPETSAPAGATQSSELQERVAALSGRVMHWRRQTGSVDCFRLVSLRVAPLRLEIEERLVARIVEFASALQADSLNPKPSALAHPLDESDSGSFADLAAAFTPNATPIHTSGPGSVASGASTGHSEGVLTGAAGGLSSVVLTGHSEGSGCGPQAAAVAFVGGPNWDVWTLVKDRRKIYIETLHIHAVDLTISFVSAPWLPWEIRGAAARGMLGGAGIAIQRRVMALADLEGAPVHLGPLTLEHPLASYGTLWGMGSRHYTRQVLQGVYKVLGSADFLGNPVGFFQSVGSGLWDFVTTPATSLAQNPGQFTAGVAEGTRSLLSNTVFAFSNAATRLSGAARKGVQTWALDREYIEEMERRRREENGGGVLRAILEGLTGVLEQPVRGAESSGLAGMVTGTAKGLVGLVAKPTASILELASRTAQSIRNATRRSLARAMRVRPPRQISADAPLTKYLREEAVGRAVLLEAEGGWYGNEVFSQCFPLAEPGEFLVLSESRVLSVESASYRPAAKTSDTCPGREWTVQWDIAFTDVLHVQSRGKALRILAMSPTLTSKPAKTPVLGTPPKSAGAAPYVHREISFEEEGAAEYLRKHLSEHANRSHSGHGLGQGALLPKESVE